MRLIALRGANTVPANEPAAILSATDELMRALMERNGLGADDLVSCIFTLTPDLDAEFPAVAAREMGLSRVPLLCAREIPVPGALPNVIRVLMHCYPPVGVEPTHVYLGEARHRHDLEAMRREITVATRLAIVCNPNNPTSTALPFDEIAAFVADVPRHVCVILDEAYVEFSLLQDPDESIALLDKHPNLVLLRTFSKIYGLCGLRVGYALAGSEAFRAAVDQVRQPFFCNAAAQAAALEALNHQDEVTRRVERNLAERVRLEDGLRELGIEPADSQANFVWFDLGEGRDEPEIVRGLAERGVLVRAGGALGRAGALRVTVGTDAENERFLAALGTLLG